MEISEKNLEIARRLQQENPVVDMHADLPGELLLRHRLGEKHVLRERYLQAWKQAGICLVGTAVYLEEECLLEGGLQNALLQIEALKEEIKELEEEICIIYSRKELEKVYRKEKIGILLYMEGLDCLGTEEGLLEMLYEKGVRGASLVWSRKNQLASGCCRADENRQIGGGITEAGKRVLKKMDSLGMFLDISHLNDDGMKELLAEDDRAEADGEKRYILATHSNARAIHKHYRNLTDEQINGLMKQGGVIGLNACSLLSGSAEKGNHLEMLVRQGRYLLEKAGSRQVCLGLDLCNSYDSAYAAVKEKVEAKGHDALSGYHELTELIAAFLEAGTEEAMVKNIMGENAFAFLRRVFE